MFLILREESFPAGAFRGIFSRPVRPAGRLLTRVLPPALRLLTHSGSAAIWGCTLVHVIKYPPLLFSPHLSARGVGVGGHFDGVLHMRPQSSD